MAKATLLATVTLAAAIAVSVGTTKRAMACGTSGPDGVSACSLAEHAEEERPRWRAGVSYVFTSTALHFSSLHADETRNAALAELTYAPTARLGISFGAGAAFGGKLQAPDGPHEFGPGIAAGLGISYRVLEGQLSIGHAFLLVGANLSFTGATTQLDGRGDRTGYEALDLRAAATAGLTWFERLSGYVVARGFGGPVYWHYLGQAETGTDTHHYQVGAGLALLMGKRVDLFVEGVPLGEQALAGGAAVSF